MGLSPSANQIQKLIAYTSRRTLKMTNLQSALVKSYSFYNLLTVPAQMNQFIVLEEIDPFWNSGRIIREDDYDVIVSKTVKMVDLKTFYSDVIS